MNREIMIETEIKDITDRIRRLNSDSTIVMNEVCKLMEKYAIHNKYYEFKYKVISIKGFNSIWVAFYDESEYMVLSHKFLDYVADCLNESVLSWDNLAMEEEILDDIREIWCEKLLLLEKW
ncbi:MAG: hypothetical protein J6Y78_11440 [Paludibacteraceae bacterium]|nr:hypothetical protein [Paludibacteraceae bacterium]